MDPVTLGMAKADARKRARDQRPWGNVAQRMNPAGRQGFFNNNSAGTPYCFQVTAEAPGEFDAIQVVFANSKPSYSDSAVMVKASVLPSAADLNGSAGIWSIVYKSGLIRLALPVAPGPGTSRLSYVTSDVTPLSSVPRTDGGSKPLVVVRAYMATTADLPVAGNGTDDFTNWASRTDGLRWVQRQMVGDGVSDPTLFTSTTNVSQSPIVGIRFFLRGRVVNIAGCGDSITDGRGTFLGEGFGELLAKRLSSPSLAVSYSNMGWSGQSTAQFAERALDILDSDIRPDVLMFPISSPNNESPPLTDAGFTASDQWLQRVLAACARVGTIPVLWTMLPTGPSVKAWGVSDAKRVAANTRALALRGRGVLVADTATPLSGAVVDGQVTVSVADFPDYIHPGDAGIIKMADALEPQVRRAGGF